MGYIGEQDASRIIVDGLRRLEYRGYDSAGVATLVNGHVDIRRCVGKPTTSRSCCATSPSRERSASATRAGDARTPIRGERPPAPRPAPGRW